MFLLILAHEHTTTSAGKHFLLMAYGINSHGKDPTPYSLYLPTLSVIDYYRQYTINLSYSKLRQPIQVQKSADLQNPTLFIYPQSCELRKR